MGMAFEYHVVGELMGVSPDRLSDVDFLSDVLVRSVSESGLTLFDVYVHPHDGGGLIAVAIIGESHVAVTTWPEIGRASVEVSSCKDAESTWEVFRMIRDMLSPRESYSLELRSGVSLMEQVRGGLF